MSATPAAAMQTLSRETNSRMIIRSLSRGGAEKFNMLAPRGKPADHDLMAQSRRISGLKARP
jgi:hypothetical protein